MHIIHSCPYRKMLDIKYISDGSPLEVPTVANGIELTVVYLCTNNYIAVAIYDLGHEDQSIVKKKSKIRVSCVCSQA